MKDLKAGIKYLILFSFLCFIFAAILLRKFVPNLLGQLFAPISVVSKVTSDVELKKTDGRTNFLILGVDQRNGSSSVGSVLTDTILVISIDESGDEPLLISIPRDLWIPQTKSKINAVYAKYAKTGKGEEMTVSAVKSVVGLPIHYYAIVGFDVFRSSVDAIGGVDVNVNESFDDYKYPIEGMEDAFPDSDRYMHVHFDAGKQTMDGEMALIYARSRHSTNMNEEGDFARARRQQKLIVALKDKVVSAETLYNPLKLKELYEAYSKNVVTNMTLSEMLAIFDKYSDLQIENVQKIVLSNEPRAKDMPGSGMLEAPTEEEREDLYDGWYVLVPYSRTFDDIHILIRSTLFE